MGFKFRKRIKIAPGIHINIGKTGVSASVGKRGATVNLSENGAKATLGVPGTGLSYSTKLSGKKNKKPATKFGKVFVFFVYVALFLAIYSYLK